MKNLMRIMRKYDYFFKAMTAYAVIFMLLYSCKCKEEPKAVKPPEKIYPTQNGLLVSDGFKESLEVYWKSSKNYIIIKESGMKYLIDYYNRSFILNITKDSLEVVALKRQALKDSLQIEVSKKYLKN